MEREKMIQLHYGMFRVLGRYGIKCEPVREIFLGHVTWHFPCQTMACFATS